MKKQTIILMLLIAITIGCTTEQVVVSCPDTLKQLVDKVDYSSVKAQRIEYNNKQYIMVQHDKPIIVQTTICTNYSLHKICEDNKQENTKDNKTRTIICRDKQANKWEIEIQPGDNVTEKCFGNKEANA